VSNIPRRGGSEEKESQDRERLLETSWEKGEETRFVVKEEESEDKNFKRKWMEGHGEHPKHNNVCKKFLSNKGLGKREMEKKERRIILQERGRRPKRSNMAGSWRAVDLRKLNEFVGG